MQPEPLYHVGDLVIINFFDIRLVGNVIAFPRGNFLAHGIIDFDSTGTPGESYVSNYDMLYLDRRYRDQIRTTSDGQIYAYYNLIIIEDYDYIIQLSTGEMVQCAEPWLTPFNRELLTRSINKFRTFRKKKRDDMVSASSFRFWTSSFVVSPIIFKMFCFLKHHTAFLHLTYRHFTTFFVAFLLFFLQYLLPTLPVPSSPTSFNNL